MEGYWLVLYSIVGIAVKQSLERAIVDCRQARAVNNSVCGCCGIIADGDSKDGMVGNRSRRRIFQWYHCNLDPKVS